MPTSDLIEGPFPLNRGQLVIWATSSWRVNRYVGKPRDEWGCPLAQYMNWLVHDRFGDTDIGRTRTACARA